MLRRQVNILNLQYFSLNLMGHKHISGKLLQNFIQVLLCSYLYAGVFTQWEGLLT